MLGPRSNGALRVGVGVDEFQCVELDSVFNNDATEGDDDDDLDDIDDDVDGCQDVEAVNLLVSASVPLRWAIDKLLALGVTVCVDVGRGVAADKLGVNVKTDDIDWEVA